MQVTAPTVDDVNRMQRLASDRRGLWWALLYTVAGLLIFVLIFNFALPTLGENLSTGGLVALGLVFSLIPAVLWLIFFYRLDRVEPEPKQMVFGVFLVGALLMAALYQPVLEGVFGIDD